MDGSLMVHVDLRQKGRDHQICIVGRTESAGEPMGTCMKA